MRVFKKEFVRRLWKLYLRLQCYFESGRDTGISPALFSCISYSWCNNVYKDIPNSIEK